LPHAQRGNNRQAIFSADADYRFYLEKLQRAWVLGEGRFKRKLKPRLKRRMAPKARGGDHKSDAYRQQTTINRD